MLTKWDLRYVELAKLVSTWSSCLSRKVGCIITVKNRVVATGYNGACSGVKSCLESGYCHRKGSASGKNLEECIGAHAEQNALIQAARLGISIEGGILYCTTFPCVTCAKLIINAGIKKIFYVEQYDSPLAKSLLKDAGVEVFQICQ